MRVSVQCDDSLAVIDDLLINETDYAKLQNKLGAEMVSLTRQNFHNQQDPYGRAWKPSQRAIAKGEETLRDTGLLMNSLTYIPVSDGVIYGTKITYAKTLHYGAVITAKNKAFLRFLGAYGFVSKKSVTIPARPFLGIGEKEQAAIHRILKTYLGEL